MPIIIPSLPALVRAANNAFIRGEGILEEKSRLVAYQPPTGGRPFLIHYPHVFYNLHNPDDSRNLVPYTWQIVYGTADNPISHEISATTTGDPGDVTTVEGPRLRQTVSAILKTLTDYDKDAGNPTVWVLNIRSSTIRAIILRKHPIERSIVIPLAPMASALLARPEWEINEFLTLLRAVTPLPRPELEPVPEILTKPE